MKLFTLLLAYSVFLCTNTAIAQIPDITTEPDGGNKKAWIGEQIGILKIVINYSRPGVKGREGKIWGTRLPIMDCRI